MARHLGPRLADRYGKDNVLIYAPIYTKDEIRDYKGMAVLPGKSFGYDDEGLLEPYRQYGCDLVLQIGDWAGLQKLPEYASRELVSWIQWAPLDAMNFPPGALAMLKHPLKIVPFSKYAERKFRELELDNVADAIWLGLDLDIWKPLDRADYPLVMQGVGFREDTFNILMVSANQQRKYLRETLEGISLFRRRWPEANPHLYIHTWQVAGDRNLEADLYETHMLDITNVSDAPTMREGGFAEPRMVQLFAVADVVMDVCLEGFGYSLIQAGSQGVPVICMHEGTGPELVRYGMEVPTDHIDYNGPMQKPVASPIEIAQALHELWSRSHRMRSPAAIEFVQQNFGWDKIAQQWYDVIDECMEIRYRKTMYILDPSETLKARSMELVELP
jgi:glycosyltransferase involved in cell wall biosynthesis